MLRNVVAVALTLLMLGLPGPTDACGDKFLVCGSGVDVNRSGGKARPASIVIYRNPEAQNNEGVADPDLSKKLSSAGHQVRTISDRQALEDAIASGLCEVVLVELAIARDLQPVVDAAPAPVQIVPVMYKPRRSEYRAVTTEFACVLRTPGRGNHINSVIEEAIRLLG